jgi:DNA-binding winged helix-turn-helix (wHTH) protein
MLTQRNIYEFDDFRVDTGQFFLTKGGGSKPITPTVFRILLVLLERAGQVVTKEELMKNVWPDSFVEEGNLNRNVSTLRKALEEKPCDHKYIETIPKTGYRFIAPVRSRQNLTPSRSICNCQGSGPRIVGRAAERNTLWQAYHRAGQGRGSLICISGDVGSGKTALVDSFLDELVQDGQAFHLARGRSSETLTESEPFMPWIEALGRVAKDPAVAAVIEKTAPTWHKEISHGGSGGSRKMKRELLDFCSEVTSLGPLVIVIDDFHWADIGSVDLLASLAMRLESTRTLAIISYRPAEMKIKGHPFLQVHAELLSRGGSAEISMRPLERKDIEDYLAAEQPAVRFSDDHAALIHAKTDGNPLFMRELLRDPAGLGDSVRTIVRAKLDRLDDTHRQLLVTASVQGREFDSAVLAKSMRMETGDVEEALCELDEVHGLVQRIREDELADGKFTVRYRFVYALCHEACYASLAPTRRAALNTSLSEAILAYYGN